MLLIYNKKVISQRTNAGTEQMVLLLAANTGVFVFPTFFSYFKTKENELSKLAQQHNIYKKIEYFYLFVNANTATFSH